MVIFEEFIQLSKQVKINFGKSNIVDIGVLIIFGYIKDKFFGFIDVNCDFDGSVIFQQQNSLCGEIIVFVYVVQFNGILEICGEKWLIFNQGDEYICLSGLVCVDDIQNDNLVFFQWIVDVCIFYVGCGVLSDVNVVGWLVWLFNYFLFLI